MRTNHVVVERSSLGTGNTEGRLFSVLRVQPLFSVIFVFKRVERDFYAFFIVLKFSQWCRLFRGRDFVLYWPKCRFPDGENA